MVHGVLGLAEDDVEDDEGDHQREGSELQPEAGAGVDRLAELDRDQPSHPRLNVGGANLEGRSRRGAVRAVGDEVEEELLQVGAGRRAERGERNAARERGTADLVGRSLDDVAAACGRPRRERRGGERRAERDLVRGGHERSALRE